MLHAAITCAKSPHMGWPGVCGQLLVNTADPADLPQSIAKALAEHGWSEADGEHYCPVHNPAEAGDVVEVAAGRYRPLGDSGWEARIPGRAPDEVAPVSIEIRPRVQAADACEPEVPEPVSATDAAAATVEAFLTARAESLEASGAPRIGPGVLASWPRTGDDADGDHELTEDDLRALLDERAAVRALAPNSRENEDPFYRPGAVYVSENDWWRFTCKTVIAGVALGIEECLNDRQEPQFTKRNVWHSVRVAGGWVEVDPQSGEPLSEWSVGND